MNKLLKSKHVSGIFVTLAILCSGCASTSQQPMAAYDLDYFQVTCSQKAQQIAMLQSMRSTRDDRLFARASNALQPWLIITNPGQYNENISRGSNRTDWLLNQKLMELAQCP